MIFYNILEELQPWQKKSCFGLLRGLDTSIIIPWLKENYDYDVIAVCGDVGQGKETDGLKKEQKR